MNNEILEPKKAVDVTKINPVGSYSFLESQDGKYIGLSIQVPFKPSIWNRFWVKFIFGGVWRDFK